MVMTSYISMDNKKPVAIFHSCITMHLCQLTGTCQCVHMHVSASLSTCCCVRVYICLPLFVPVSPAAHGGSVGYQCNWITSLSSCPGVC